MWKSAALDGGGDHPVAEDLPPSSRSSGCLKEQRPPLVAPADELEEEVGAVAVDGQVPDLVDDEQAGTV
jgi:hypothetical protein